ncbi:MAG TPA: CoA-transferase, partial [Burkholderiales bacterium]
MSYAKLTREEIAARIAKDIPEGAYVNLGIGMPTLVANHLPRDREIILHSENGILGMGPAPAKGAEDWDLINAGNGEVGIAALLKAGRVRKIVCSYPRQLDSHHFQALYRAGKVELDLVPQGTLSERMRAAGAGIGGFYTPTGYGTDL